MSRALSELGQLRFGAGNVDDALGEIVRVTHSIFAVDGAGLMLIDREQHLRNAAVSDPVLHHLEDLQVEHHEGPCIDAYEAKELIRAEDLDGERRWPLFTPAALKHRIRAILASPIPYNAQAVGVVAVVSRIRRPWTAEGELALVAFTDLAALTIAAMVHRGTQSDLARQLQQALDTRVMIEQAKGVLMERHGLSAREAYHQLRAQARSHRRRLADVAAEVAHSTAPER